jgi:Ca2+-binding EF-hand superfamily protein
MRTAPGLVFTLLALLLLAPTDTRAAQSRFASQARQAGEMRFRDMDRNNDGVITRAEWRGSLQSFRTHDWNSDGILSGDEVRPGVGRGGSIDEQDFDRDERFEDLDLNSDGRVERSEWHGSADAFQWLDRNNDGVLRRAEVVGRTPGQAGRAVRRRTPPPSATAPAGNCVASAAQVVDDVYQQVLERPADQASAGLTQELAPGKVTVRDIVAQVAKSPEHAERFYWQPIIAAVYRQVMKRDATEQELRETAANLAAGRRQLTDVIARVARRAADNDEGAVRILYRRLLGREADPEGLRGFTDQARREGIESVARDLVTSAEYRQRAGSSGLLGEDTAAYEAAVRALYRHVLGRDPDPNGLRNLTRVAASSGFDAVVASMLASSEYQRLFGNDVVPGRGVRYCGASQL